MDKHGSTLTLWHLRHITSILCVLANVTTNVSADMQLDFSGCNKDVSCFKGPAECNSTEDCDFHVQFKYNKTNNSVEFAMTSSFDWISLGFRKSKELSMDNNVGETCVKNLSRSWILLLKTTGYKAEFFPVTGIQDIRTNVINGRVICRYVRSVAPPPETFLADLSEKLYLTVAYGPLTDTGLAKHKRGNYASSDDVINFQGPVSDINAKQLPHSLLLVHACSMTLAWVFCASMGAFTARNRNYIKIGSAQIWLKIHQPLMMLALLLTVSGVLSVVRYKGGWKLKEAGPHPYIGLCTFISTILQTTFAIFRPSTTAPRRWIFNVLHKVLGTTTLLGGILSTAFGYRLLSDDLTPLAIWLFVLSISVVLVEVCKYQHLGANAVVPENGVLPPEEEISTSKWVELVTSLLTILLFIISLAITCTLIFHFVSPVRA